MTKYAWPLPGEGVTAQEILATESVTSIPGIKTYSLDARRDVAIAELIVWAALNASSTINAGSYPGTTNDQKVQAAITAAVVAGAKYVFVPAGLLPYDPTLVTFNTSVQMIREGGNPNEWDVKAYGASGASGIRDRTAFTNAILGAQAGGGGNVRVSPNGVTPYLTDQPIACKTTVNILGIGWDSVTGGGSDVNGSVIQAASAGVTGIFDVSGTVNVTIAGLRILAFNAANTTYGIADDTSPGATYLEIFNNHFRYFGGDAIRLRSSVNRITHNSVRLNNNGPGHIIHLNLGSSDNFIAFNDIGSTDQVNGHGIFLDGATNGSQVNTIVNNEIFNCAAGIRLTTNSFANRIEGNRCEKHALHGIWDSGSSTAHGGNQIIGNHCFNEGTSAAGNWSGIFVDGGGGALIEANICEQIDTNANSGFMQVGILVSNGASDCTITGNQCFNLLNIGIFISSSPRNKVTDNDCRVIQKHGINLSGAGCVDNIVANSYVYLAGQAANNTYYGILVDTSAGPNMIEHNTVRAGTLSNKIAAAVRINDAGCTGNIVQFNDILGQGVTADYIDVGTGTGFRPPLMRQIIAFAASITPNAQGGEDVEVGTLTGALTVNAPTNVPRVGMRLRFWFTQDGTGGRAVSWNAAFKTAWSDTGNTLNKQSMIAYRYNGTNWVQEGAQTPYV